MSMDASKSFVCPLHDVELGVLAPGLLDVLEVMAEVEDRGVRRVAGHAAGGHGVDHHGGGDDRLLATDRAPYHKGGGKGRRVRNEGLLSEWGAYARMCEDYGLAIEGLTLGHLCGRGGEGGVTAHRATRDTHLLGQGKGEGREGGLRIGEVMEEDAIRARPSERRGQR